MSDDDDQQLNLDADEFRDSRKTSKKTMRSNFLRHKQLRDGVFWISEVKVLRQVSGRSFGSVSQLSQRFRNRTGTNIDRPIDQGILQHQYQGSSFQRLEPEARNASEFENAVLYSIGKAKRWELLAGDANHFAGNADMRLMLSDEGIVPVHQEVSHFKGAVRVGRVVGEVG